jgi:hypothetical protein
VAKLTDLGVIEEIRDRFGDLDRDARRFLDQAAARTWNAEKSPLWTGPLVGRNYRNAAVSARVRASDAGATTAPARRTGGRRRSHVAADLRQRL